MRFFLSCLSFFFLLPTSKAQVNPIEDPYQNQIIKAHYKTAELHSIQQNDSLKFNSIVYYYTKSFILEKVSCNCDQIDLLTFDISQYEYLRKKKERYTRHFEKYGFKLTLLSIDELKYKLPIHLSQ